MWKLFAVVVSLAVSGSAWATTSYSIDLETQIGARKPLRTHMVVLEGQEGVISSKQTLIKLVPTETGQGTVKIQINAFRRTRTGLQKVSKSAVIVRPNEAAEISEKTEDGENIFRAKLTVKPKESEPGFSAEGSDSRALRAAPRH